MQLVLGGGILAAFAHGPLALLVLIAALSPYNLGPAGFALAISGYCVAMFAALSACALSGRLDHLRAALTMPLYWPLSTVAALWSQVDLALRPHHWAKTAHGVTARKRYAADARAAMPKGGQSCACSSPDSRLQSAWLSRPGRRPHNGCLL
jgi:hypothetical protein